MSAAQHENAQHGDAQYATYVGGAAQPGAAQPGAAPSVNETEAKVIHDMLVLEVDNIPKLEATACYNDSIEVKTSKGWKFKKSKRDIDAGFFKLMEHRQV